MKDRTIPKEIMKFFDNPGGHSLIVKGLAGTGKTTFALQLIEHLGTTSNSFYLSTRVTDESLFRQFPWLHGLLKKNVNLRVGDGRSKSIYSEKLYEDSGSDISIDLNIKPTRHLPKFPVEKDKVDREELKKLEGRIEMGDAGIMDSSVEVDSDTITFDLGSDLPEMDSIYDMVEGWKPKRSLVVIDSVDALSERYGVNAARLMNTLQKDLVESSATNLLFVLETGSDSSLDYLGDGVIDLSTGEHNGRRIRIMNIKKLRGAEIRRSRYLYTLNGGRLTAFDYKYTDSMKELRLWEYVPDISDEYVSTGNEDIDSLIGSGIQMGSIVAIEIGANVPYQYTDMLKTGLVCNFAAQKRGVVTVPSMKATAEVVKDVLEQHLGGEVFENYVRVFESTPKVFEVSPTGESETANITLPMDGSDVETELKWSNIEYSLSNANKPFLSMVGFDTLESVYGPDVMENLTDHLTALRKGEHIFIGFLRPTSKSTQKLTSMAHIHLKVEDINGTIVIYAQKPYTELYFLSFIYRLGFPKASLLPIV